MCILPLTRETEKLWYNQRMIIDNNVLTEPVTWVITKINRIANNGTVKLTFAQDFFDPHTDYIELDDQGNVIGKWADYYTDGLAPEGKDDTDGLTVKVSVVGKAKVKVGGGYKRLYVNFFNNDEEVSFIKGQWSYSVNGEDASDLIDASTEGLKENEISLCFIGTDDYIGETLIVSYTTGNNISGSIELSIAGL